MFFKLHECRYNKKDNTVKLVYFVSDNYEPEIPKHEKSTTKWLLEELQEKVRVEFEYRTHPVTATQCHPSTLEGNKNGSLDALLKHKERVENGYTEAVSTDKAMKVKNIEYLLGRPIKVRPIQIKYLRNTEEEQVIAGTMHFLTKREYKKKDPLQDGAEITKTYWTFVIDDGRDRVQCVFFPTDKTRSKFEILVDRTMICASGVRTTRDKYVSFRISGISYCEIV